MLTIVPTLLLLLFQAEPPAFTSFELSREKVGNRVTVNAEIRNVAHEDLSDLSIVFVYYEGEREVKRSTAERVTRLTAGQATKVVSATSQVARFDRIEVELAFGNARFLYEINQGETVPKLKDPSIRRSRLELVAARHSVPDPAPGEGRVKLVMRNTGSVAAAEPYGIMTLISASGDVVRSVVVRLADAVDSGAEDTIEVTFPQCPEFERVRTRVVWRVDKLDAPPGPLGGGAKMEAGNWSLLKMSDGTILVTGRIRNGLPTAVKDVRISLILDDKEIPHFLPHGLAIGEERDFTFFIDDPGEVGSLRYSLAFEEGEDPSTSSGISPPVARRIEHRTSERPAAEEGPVASEDDPETGKVEDLPEPPEAEGEEEYRVGIAGVQWIPGYFNDITKRHSGDVAFLKLQILDSTGQPARLEGSLKLMLYKGQRPVGRASRNLRAGAWKMDASRINSRNATPEIVAYDSDEGCVWIGFVRGEEFSFSNLRMDVEFKVRRVGTWEWKGVGEPWSRPPCAPNE